MQWQLGIGVAGLVIGMIALQPILFPPQPQCDTLRTNVIEVSQKIKSNKAAMVKAEIELETIGHNINAVESELELLVGFLNEQTMFKEMKELAYNIANVYQNHLKIYGENKISSEIFALTIFFESLVEIGYPKVQDRMDKRHTYQAFGLSSDVYLIFDSMPKSEAQITRLTDALLDAPNNIANSYSDRMWRLGGWDSKFLQFGAQEKVIHLRREQLELRSKLDTYEKMRQEKIDAQSELEERLSFFASEFHSRDCAGSFPDV